MDKIHTSAPGAIPDAGSQLPPSTVSLQLGLTGVLQLDGEVARVRGFRLYNDEGRRGRATLLLEHRSSEAFADRELVTLELTGEGRTLLEACSDLIDQVVRRQGAIRVFLNGGAE